MSQAPAAQFGLNQPRPAAASAPSAALPPPAVDPFRLLNKYKFVLAAAVVIGIVLGVGAFLLLSRFAPSYRPVVVLESYLGQEDPGKPFTNDIVPKDDMERFMQTRVRIMTSPIVLRSVIEDRRLRELAPTWAKRFEERGNINQREALLQIQKDVGARTIPETRLIELSFSYKNAVEATAMLGMVKESFLNFMQNQGREQFRQQLEALNAELTDLTGEVTRRTTERQRIITTNRLDSLDQQSAAVRDQLGKLNTEVIDINLSVQAGRKQLEGFEQEMKNPSGVPRYPDSLRSEVEKEPELQELRQTMRNMEAQLASMLEQGLTEKHRDYMQTESMLKGYQRKFEESQQRLLRENFAAQIDQLRRGIQGFEAQLSESTKKTEEFSTRLVELTRFQAQLQDIDRQLATLTLTQSQYQERVNNIRALEKMTQQQAVIVIAPERIPDERAFPKITVIVPVVMIAFVGLVAGLVVLREVLDQRVKSPGDVAMIPRARVLGIVPDAGEDPESGDGAVETAFRDKNKSIIAESYRQIRSTLTKRLQQAGHKTVVVMAGLPESGATTAACNLALAAAGSGQKVLIIDANMRRPALHRVFALQEGAGLVDVLSNRIGVALAGGEGAQTSMGLAQAIQKTADGKLSVLTVGSKDKRMVELLSTDAMTQMLAEAKGMFDLVILDTPPAVVAGDGLTLANKCDATVLVVKAYCEKRGMVARIRNDLLDARAEFVGVVVNGVRAAAGGYLRKNIRTANDYHQAA
jgi:polysaccharide biosynthesis transport protein